MTPFKYNRLQSNFGGGLVYFANLGDDPRYLLRRLQAITESGEPIQAEFDRWGRLNDQIFTRNPHSFIVVHNNLIIEKSNDFICE